MPVLEWTALRLKGVDIADPSLLKNLSDVRERLQTNSVFYHCIEDPSLIYILGLWPSLEAHRRFLNSPERDEVLGAQESQLGFEGTVHMELDTMDSLPLDAPVMAMARLFIQDDCVDAFTRGLAEYRQTFIDGAKPYNVVDGWRIDAETGKHESLLISGWTNAQAQIKFMAKASEHAGFAATRANCQRVEVRHAYNMEKQD
ncbi:hypothetical protein P154DRAFT_19323 [Amniculicola lignicola CBS 123094]|uniref:ABM domain-containing protein n=1 Tax=Amniculicola lignicola CBS 123094 TaxID=1392246 RepID=A0A6A5WXC6_9PLEO|nr:hypothetical protein P154DRAFT_19323 [Amniculicola lignicola CBS 123094]